MCECIHEANTMLASRNGELVITLYPVVRPVIETMKLNSKKREKPPMMVASYCPFCGEKYNGA